MTNRSIDLKIRTVYRDLSKKEKLIADFIIEKPEEIVHGTISDVANIIGVADSTLFQFTRKLGFKGFKDFRVAVITQQKITDATIHEKVTENDNELEIAKKVFEANLKTLKDSKALLDYDSLKKAGELIYKSNMLTFFGVGGSAIVAEDGYHKFLRTPINCQHSFDFHNQLIMASLMSDKDCALLISHTGRTVEMQEIAQLIKLRGAKLILITSYPQSEIAKLADVVFISLADEIAYRSEALAARISQLSIIDSLFIIVNFKDQKRSKETLRKVREVIKKKKT